MVFDEQFDEPIAITQLSGGWIASGRYVWNPENPQEFSRIPRQRGLAYDILALSDGRFVVTNDGLSGGELAWYLRIWSLDELEPQ